VYLRALERRAPELLAAAGRGRAYYMACNLLFYLARGEVEERDDWLIGRIEEEVEGALSPDSRLTAPEPASPAPQEKPRAEQRAKDAVAKGRDVKGQQKQPQGNHPKAEDRQKAKKVAENK